MSNSTTVQSPLEAVRAEARKKIRPDMAYIAIGYGTCGIGNGAEELFAIIEQAIRTNGSKPVRLKKTGCFGYCSAEPLVNVYLPGKPLLVLHKVEKKEAVKILKAVQHGDEGFLRRRALCKIEEWDFLTSKIQFGTGFPGVPRWNEVPFFKGQQKLVLRDAGLIDPTDIEEYLAVGGYSSLEKALLQLTPARIIQEIKDSGLRGRGGAGFPTGKKWELMRQETSPEKYMVCNADEGDPGAYMNRNEIESDPHALIEGMTIAAYAMGAHQGFFYVRAEYPLAVERLKTALEQARKYKVLGPNILDSGFGFDIELVEGAGAFVCGEETALIASAEGKAGRPVPRPPFPAQKGYNGKPTTINNVETLCNVPAIISKGADWFSSIGTAGSPGTKVFSLVGKVKNTGLVELPLGTPLEQIVYTMGEGAGKKKKIRAVQTGGPSGGCIPATLFNATVDYESLNSLGAIMGSGGMVVLDSDNCMVDTARYFVEFTTSESCGKCTPCREGLSQALEILTRITRGEGTEEDLVKLEELAKVIKDSSLCGLGQTSANPILTTLNYFRDEYLTHIHARRCDAGICENLFLALCENSCPLHMNIPGYLQLLKEGRIEEAFELTLRDNPLPGTVGRICHFHCQMRCRRDTIDEPVHQGEIHRYLADTIYKMGKERDIYAKLLKEKLPRTGKRISIIGGGPAGLTAAFYLVRLGHEVTVYDDHPKAGGIMRYGIPDYRLPKDVLDKEISLLKKLGVKFRMNTRVGKDIPLEEIDENSDAVFIAVGAGKDMDLEIPGKDLKGVYPGYELLEHFALGKIKSFGKNVVIIGGGNVAIDVARTALRLGSKVTIVYRRDRDALPANPQELKGAEEEGIEFLYLSAPKRILGERGHVTGLEIEKMELGDVDASGRRKPVPTGKKKTIPCDTVVIAVGEKVDSDFLKAYGVKVNKDGTVKADPISLNAGPSHIFAGGDAITGPATAAEAMGLAKKAAESIDTYLMKEKRFHRLFVKFIYKDEVPFNPASSPQNRPKEIPPAERINNFMEISQGYSGEQARLEAERCLRCDVRAVTMERR